MMLKSIVNVIEGSVTVVSSTNGTVYLSDGTHWKKSKFNQNRTLVAALLRRESDIYTAALDRKINEAKVSKARTIESLKTATSKSDSKRDERFVLTPSQMNSRFICGHVTGEDKFVMVFWNYYNDCSNSHGDLEQWYRDNYDSSFRACCGGFYMSNGHNNCNSEKRNKFYLFGRSDSFGNFKNYTEEIKEYGNKFKLDFIIGRTDFNNDATDNFGNYVGSDELSAFE